MVDDERWQRISANPPVDEGTAIPLPESGWGALIAWLAGPQWAGPLRRHDVPDVRTDVVSREGVVRYQCPRGPLDQESIDDDIAQFLAAADVPPPPRSTVWAVRGPGGLSAEAFWSRVYAAMEADCPEARLPRDTRICLERVLASILR
ncbi:DUF5956 family protein [Quadrisphaera sp. GCM10027208]|uniref:DUF5956 family protein n=1 Tax=Quadrisphaera sp. GCM10027208 TaxID=3273423 RepID=UPI003620962F